GNLSLWFDERVGKTIQFRASAGGGEAVGPSGGESPIGTIAFEFGEAVIVSSASNPSGTVFFRTEEFPEIWSAEYSSWETKIFFGVQPDLAVNPVKEVSSEANQARRQILYAVKEANQEQLERSADLWLNALEGLRVELLRRECAKLLSLLDEGLLGEAAETQFAGPVRDRAADIAPKRAWPELRAWLRGTLLEYLPPGKKAESGSRAATWEEIIQLLEDGESPGLSLEEAAARAGIHPVTFSRLFKQRIGVNFVRYMVDRRMNRASFLLLNRNDSVAAVAAAVGYADLRHFSHLFKRAFGMTPGEYRKHHGSTGKPR
ncbi:AraC family transcriptional regulator, partial [Paenibacillus sepulcri]|nr:AraC family transcriptional regulator [Paenibacillus sepulcri]